MTVIDLVPLVLRDVEATIGTSDYKHAISSATFTPSTSPVAWTGLGGKTFQDVTSATWTLDLQYVQDWDTAGSLSRYLYENETEKVTLTLRPRSGAGPSFTAEITIVPGAIGGPVNANATASVTLPCTGKPELVPAA